jgi:iduronate 2-sulfatase
MTARSAFAVAVLAALAAPAAAAEPAQKKPNVLLIVVDDLNCAVGCYGHPVVKTPNIDRLAARGVRFEHAYCQYPLCNPSRTSFLSGRLPDHTRIFDNNTPPRTTLGANVVFLPEHFKAHGYFTARVGKVAHGKYEDAVRWDVSENARRGEAGDEEAAERVEFVQQGEGGLKLTWRATRNKDEQEPDGHTARRVAGLIREHKDGPFFIAAGFHKPHLPWVAPQKYFDLYPPEKIELPKEPADVRKGVPELAFTRTAGDDKMTDKERQQAVAAYYSCVSFTDANVGVLLDTLDELKLWDSTVVVFVSDHGFHLGEHGGLWRKMTLFEEANRVPMIVAVPGKRPAVSPRLVELLDLYPTLADLCGLPKPEGLEGMSVKPLLDDPRREWDRAVAYTVVARGKKEGDRPLLGRAVRTERYRYTEWGDEKQAELYDHQADPKEFVNLAKDPRHAETLAMMRKLLKTRWKE